LLTIAGSSGLRLPHELAGPYRRTTVLGTSARSPTTPSPALFGSGAPSIDRGIGFQVHSLLAQQLEHAPPPPRRPMILAAYRAHLAGHVRYYGPITPVDLHI
jgi:hypothetical protein